MGEPPFGLILRLAWSPDQLSAYTNEHVTIRLQDGAGRTIALMSVPQDQFQQELSRTLKPCVLMSPNGVISTSLEEAAQESGASKAIAVDRLIAEAIAPDMLEDEPMAVVMLSDLRLRLLKSLQSVDQAIELLRRD